MYEKYWNFKEKPFQNTPDPRYLYLSSQHEDALMKLSYAVAQRLGCGMLSGVFGCGKTLLGRVLLNELGSSRYACAFINNPQVSEPAELFRAIVRSLNPQALPDKKSDILLDPLIEKLQAILIDNARDSKETLIVIDEAHTIEDTRILEQMRLLLNFQLEDRFLLTLLILGQPEIRQKVENMKPLDQRVAVRCHIGPLSEEDVSKYISHRLKVGGYQPPSVESGIFSRDGISAIFQHTGGIPRRINNVCDLALMTGFARKADKIDGELIKQVIKDFSIT